MPAHRFYNLVVAFLKDDKLPEGIEQIDNALAQADLASHPFFDTVIESVFEQTATNGPARTTTKRETPIEEQTRRAKESRGMPYRVPEWWAGEQAAYKNSMAAMKKAPKDIGQKVN